MFQTYRTPTRQEPVYCRACGKISSGHEDAEWYTWTSPAKKDQFCRNCLEDPGQHWGEELYLYRKASIGHGSPESIHSILDQIGDRLDIVPFGEEDRHIANSQPGTAPASSSYRHSPLITALDHIRILRLHPNTENDRVECTLEVVAFDQHYSDYNAVSYTWGDPLGHKVDIHVRDPNGDWASFKVLENLHQLLLHMRHLKEEKRLWIDAICIDQSKDEAAMFERKAQLDLMGSIYRQASLVMIWLGLAALEEHSDIVFEATQMRDVKQMKSHEFRKGMACIVQRPWFQRTWIIQELALNERAPWLLCGHQQVLWPKFMAAFKFIFRYLTTVYMRENPRLESIDSVYDIMQVLLASTMVSLLSTRT
jgi:hypothetical protein